MSCKLFIVFFFFFSSRRRHTRLQGDWSSDVCSSDLHSVGLSYGWPARVWWHYSEPPARSDRVPSRQGRRVGLSSSLRRSPEASSVSRRLLKEIRGPDLDQGRPRSWGAARGRVGAGEPRFDPTGP